MKNSYSIKEILIAVNDLQIKKREKRILERKNISFDKENSTIPKDTLKLIEEAEQLNNK